MGWLPSQSLEDGGTVTWAESLEAGGGDVGVRKRPQGWGPTREEERGGLGGSRGTGPHEGVLIPSGEQGVTCSRTPGDQGSREGVSAEGLVPPGQPAPSSLGPYSHTRRTLTCPGTLGVAAQEGPGQGASWSRAGPPAAPAQPLSESALLVVRLSARGFPGTQVGVQASQLPCV